MNHSRTMSWLFLTALCVFGIAQAAQVAPEPRERDLIQGPTRQKPRDPPSVGSADSKVDRDMLGGVEDRAPVRSADENYYEAQAYNYLLVKAHKTPVDNLASNARRDLTFAHLFEEPDKCRGELIHIEGRLKRLRRFDAPKVAEKEGVPRLYEGWVFTESSFNNPYCVIVSEVPTGVRVGDDLDTRVKFDGYFFKRYRYKAAFGRVYDAPLLIGRELSSALVPASPETQTDLFSKLFFPSFLAVLGATAALIVGLTWWFRRGDRHVQAGLKESRKITFVEPGGTHDTAEP